MAPAVKGKRLLPQVVDELAYREPEHVLYIVPRTDHLEDGMRDITAGVFANAVNRTAHWLEGHIGKSKCFDTIAYVGPHDLRYMLMVLAGAKTGHKVLLLSPRNRIAGQLGVMGAVNCTTIVLPKQHSETLAKTVEQGSLRLLVIPEQDVLLRKEQVDSYPYNKTFDEAKTEPLYVVHTSGSTGVPKPIICTNAHHAAWDYLTGTEPDENGLMVRHMYPSNCRYLNTAPLFHQLGFVSGMSLPIWTHSTSVLGPPNAPPNLATVEGVLDRMKIHGMILPPPLVDGIARNPTLLEKVKSVGFIATGGGPVSGDGGVKVASVTDLRNIIGSSESLLFSCYKTTDPNDWKYFKWHPSSGVQMREVAPGLYEQWVIRVPKYLTGQATFHLFTDLDEYNTRDLYRRHPDPKKSDHYCSSGRSDDIIVLSSGEKIQPLEMESIINNHPAVSGSLVVGAGRFQAAALLELRDGPVLTEAQRTELLASLWENVKEANAIAPGHAQIHRDYIIIAEPRKPFERADKGTIKRLATVTLYEEEIRRFYERQEDHEAETILIGAEFESLESTATGIRNLIARVMKAKPLQDDDNLFAAGLDSLMVFMALRALNAVVKEKTGHPGALRIAFVYSNPTVTCLAQAFYSMLQSKATEANGVLHSHKLGASQGTLAEKIKELLEKYTKNLTARSTTVEVSGPAEGSTVLLTGSTGSLGSYLLEVLVNNSKVRKVICLNRSKDGRTKQAESSNLRGLPMSWPDDKVQFFQADLSKHRFGLEEEAFNAISREADLVIHNAWPVNFNWSLESFEPHIAGVRNLVEFSNKSSHGARIAFVSSIGAVARMDASRTVPETIVDDVTVAESTGYGASKLVAELILAKAAEQAGVRATICRVGQVAGPVLRGSEGSWNKQEWLPTIVASSAQLGMLPSNLGGLDRVDWVPVDLLSKILAELSGLGNAFENGIPGKIVVPRGLEVFNIVNPRSIEWEELVPSIVQALGGKCQVVPWSTWTKQVRETGRDGASAARDTPALKLLGFYDLMVEGTGAWGQVPLLDTSSAASYSRTLRELPTVQNEWMELWMRQWGF